MQFKTQQFTVAPLPKMRLKVQSIHQHCMTDPNITATDLHRLLGMLVFMASLVWRGRLRLCPVQWWATTEWCHRTGSWSDRIQIPQCVLSEVAWWASPAVLQGLPLATKETEVTLFTDASSLGWGAQLGSRSTRGLWSASQRSWHINALEMQAVINAVRDFLPHLRSRVVRLMFDNAVTGMRTKWWQVFNFRSHHFSTYLMHLFRDRLLPSTIISHHTSVASMLHHWKYDPATDPHIKLLIRAFRLEQPVQCRIMPKWDLHLVLSALMSPPFASEVNDRGRISDEVTDLRWRTMKTVFLLALASARRRSYLHVLSIASDKCVSPEGGVLFYGKPDFWPRTSYRHRLTNGSQSLECLRYHSSQPGWIRENVMSSQTTQAMSKGYKKNLGGRQWLFIHWNRAIKDIMRSHISKWIIETVKKAYMWAGRDQEDRVTAHEVRTLSASWACNCQVALPDILSAAYWRSSGVFQNSYLRNMASIADGMSTLGSVVVAQQLVDSAQQVVDPGHLPPP